MIEKTLGVAMTSQHDIKMGCIITDRKGRVLATGVNSRKSHPMQSRFAKQCGRDDKIFLHAEISALIRCRGEGHTLYVGRWRKDGAIGLARPCPICFGAIIDAGIRQVVYTETGGTVSVISL